LGGGGLKENAGKASEGREDSPWYLLLHGKSLEKGRNPKKASSRRGKGGQVIQPRKAGGGKAKESAEIFSLLKFSKKGSKAAQGPFCQPGWKDSTGTFSKT